MIDVSKLRHEKEKRYLLIMQIVGVLLWTVLLFFTMGMIILWAIPVVFIFWIAGLFFKAAIYGESVKVTVRQFPEIYNLVLEQSKKLNLVEIPDVFIYNGSGMMNAFAIKYISKRYIILMSDLIDLSLRRNKMNELAVIIAHELGHHAAGHTNLFKNLLLKPAYIIPFLGSAYSRACELTADRIAYALVQDLSATQKALVSLALGSESLANDTNIDEFIAQEQNIPALMGFIHNIYSTHSRMTKRVIEIAKFHNSFGKM